jgi:hypothetical protein
MTTYLSGYIQNEQTALFESTGAFFAFSADQLEKGRAIGPVRYASLGSGMICPTINCKTLLDGLDSIYQKGIASDIAENDIKAIIHRELANHECQIVGSIDAAVDMLADYPNIDRAAIQAEWPEFMQHCIDNDYF